MKEQKSIVVNHISIN